MKTRWSRLARRFASVLLALSLVLAPAFAVGWGTSAFARPGGGHTFSGGRSSGGGSRGWSGGGSRGGSSGGGGVHVTWGTPHGGTAGDGGDVLLLLFVLVAIGVLVVVVKRQASASPGWSTQGPWQGEAGDAQRLRRRIGSARSRLGRADPNLSLVLFEDFVYGLYARAQEARGKAKKNGLDELAAYISEGARAELLRGGQPDEVSAIVIGQLRYIEVAGIGKPRLQVELVLETNYTETTGGRDQSYYAVERWRLGRASTVPPRTPEAVRTFGCPSCGAPLSALRGSTCSYCNRVVDTGEFEWVVESIEQLERETRGPQLIGDTEEQGTDLPTVVAGDAEENLAALAARDHAFSMGSFEARVRLVFDELQVAWSTHAWNRARPFVSDALFQMQLYWIRTYQRAGLRNVTEGARITRIELAAVQGDRSYDALTVRVFATGLDYTIEDATGRVVSGSKARPRAYSEYWTFIRGASTEGPARAEKRCPSCGASLKINMTGSCEYCGARVTSGEFDWVLSRIEQDDVYTG